MRRYTNRAYPPDHVRTKETGAAGQTQDSKWARPQNGKTGSYQAVRLHVSRSLLQQKCYSTAITDEQQDWDDAPRAYKWERAKE